MNPNKALWEKGDFTKIAESMRDSGGSGYPFWGKDCNGELDPGRSHPGCADIKDKRCLYPPPPEGFISPMLWGVESDVTERFGSAGVAKEDISFVKDTFNFEIACTPSELVDRFRKFYGPTMNAFEAAEKNDKAADLQRELEELFDRKNTSADGKTSIPANYLKVTVTRR